MRRSRSQLDCLLNFFNPVPDSLARVIRYIRNLRDGKKDGKVYVLKISKDEIFKNSINGSEYSLVQLQEAKSFVDTYSGNSDVFSMNPTIYDYFVEIVGNKEMRQEMVNIVSQDDGSGKMVNENNREYGGYITNNAVKAAEPGEMSNKNGATINIPEGYSTFHSHPSGIDYQNNKMYQQFPTIKDIINSEGFTSYVFGRYDGVVYIYNNNGILSTIPHNFFVDFKK